MSIAHYDVLRLRAAPGEEKDVLATMESTQIGLIGQGQTRSVTGAFWILVDLSGTLGWVNMRDVAVPRIVVVVDETVGDLREVTLDLIGLGDDALRGYRVHVLGEPVDGGFSLRNVEVTNLCARGVAEGRLCL